MVLKNSVFPYSQAVASIILLTTACSRSDLAPYEEGLPENIIPIQSSRVVEVDPRPASKSDDSTVVVSGAAAAATAAASTGAAVSAGAADSVETLGGVNPDSLDEFEAKPAEAVVSSSGAVVGSATAAGKSVGEVTGIVPNVMPPKVSSTATAKPVVAKHDKETKKVTEDANNKFASEKGVVTEFQKPLNGKVISKFGELDADGFANEGINIAGSKGQKVACFSNGKVVYAGSDKLPEYGNMVIVKHDDGLISTYAHLNDISVKKGQILKVNDKIGTVGQTGEGIDTPQLYFQVMKDNKPIDPTKYF